MPVYSFRKAIASGWQSNNEKKTTNGNGQNVSASDLPNNCVDVQNLTCTHK